MWFTEEELVDGMPPYKGWASLNRVLDYNYSATDIIDTHSEVSADYVLQQQHTGMFGGYLDVPSINTTASGNIHQYNADSTGNDNGLFWDTNWYYAPYKRQGETQWGYKPMLSNQSDHYNAWRLNLNLNTTSNMTSGGYHIDMSHATSTGTVTGTQTKTESANTDGTLHHDEFFTNHYKMIPYDGTGDYLFVCLASPNGGNVGIKDTQFYMPNTVMDYFRDGPTSPRAAFRYYKLCATTVNNRTLQGTEDGYITFDRAYKYVGVLYSLNNATKPNNYILMSAPTFYIVDTDVEKTVRQETQQQTQQLKDTTGSGTIVDGAIDGYQGEFDSRLGFVSETTDIVSSLYTAAMNTNEKATITFPPLKWDGQVIIAEQAVPVVGWLPKDYENRVRDITTLSLFLAWIHGIHSLYARIFLGEKVVEVDEE